MRVPVASRSSDHSEMLRLKSLRSGKVTVRILSGDATSSRSTRVMLLQ